jgi:hypothetical protein
MTNIGLTAAERHRLGSAIWGRPEIEGRMLCKKYGIKIHVIEKYNLNGQEVIGHLLVDGSRSIYLDEVSTLYIDNQVVHVLNEGSFHFVPILHKTAVPNKHIKKEVCTLTSEGVQSESSSTDGLTLYSSCSVAASPEQVSGFVAKSKSPNMDQ